MRATTPTHDKAVPVARPRCEVWRAGLSDYEAAWSQQNALVEARAQGKAPDRLILLEHPHTYTLGSAGQEGHLLLTDDEMAARGIRLVRTDRGGDITYHGPGQLVGYPILQLPRASESLRIDVVGYVRGLEQVIIRTLADYGLVGGPIAGLTGVWVDTPSGAAKVCAIGVRISARAVTKHGFALNVNTDLSYFEGIIPCGICDKGVCSLGQLLSRPVDMDEAAGRVIHHFGTVFGLDMSEMGHRWPNP